MPLPYRDYNEISLQISDFFQNQLGVSLDPSTLSRAFMDMWIELIYSIYLDINSITSIFSIQDATGTDLDNIGRFFNLTRRQKTVPIDFGQNVKIMIDMSFGPTSASDLLNLFNSVSPTAAQLTTITIPAGTSLTDPSETSVVLTLEDVTMLDSAYEVFVKVRGIYGSSNISPHMLTKVLKFGNSDIYKYLKADNIDSITGAQGQESDNDFRYRIVNAIYIASTANKYGIESAAMSVPSIANVTTTNNRYGIGTFEILIDSTNAIVSESEIDAVTSVVEEAAALGTKPVVTPPNYIGVYIKYKLKFDSNFVNRTDYLSISQQAVKNYINNLPQGSTLYMENIIRVIKALTPTILNVDIEKIGIGQYTDIPGKDKEISNIVPTSIGDMTCAYNEKFVTGLAVIEPYC